MKSSQLIPMLALAVSIAPGAAHADAAKTAIFPFSLDDTSLQGEMKGKNADETRRLTDLDKQLTETLVKSGQYAPVTLPPDVAKAADRDLRTCGGCDIEMAKQAGAQFSVYGWVQKVSNLILNINLVVNDVATGKPVRAGSVDIRGDTDESWSRGLRYLLANRILNTPE